MHSVHNVMFYHRHHHILFNFVFNTLDEFYTETFTYIKTYTVCHVHDFVQEAIF